MRLSLRKPLTHLIILATAAILAGGCATRQPIPESAAARPQPGAVLRSITTDRAVEDRILALDPERITEADVHDTLAKGPVPRIVLVHGGIFPVYLAMQSFGRFLTEMGYPVDKIRHPGDRRWSHTPYEDGAQIAGLIAWYYEHEGMHPMIIGHSQGGVEAVKVLYELAGRLTNPVDVWNPYTDASDNRTSIIDPLTGKETPVIGTTVSYASAVGAGSAALLLPNQWNMVSRVYSIPDTTEDFTGYSIKLDVFALTPVGTDEKTLYHAMGTAKVRNVVLPQNYGHVTVPFTQSMAEDKGLRAWIDAYTPDSPEAASPPDSTIGGVLWAADNWWSIKKHWALEAQRIIRAKRAILEAPLTVRLK